MAYMPGLDLNTQISLETQSENLKAGIVLGAVGLATFGLLPKEFAAVKSTTDIIRTCGLMAVNHFLKSMVDDEVVEQPAQIPVSPQKVSGNDVVGF